jgi:hypothetical protein
MAISDVAETIRPELPAPASDWPDSDLAATWMDHFKMDKVFAGDDKTKAVFIKAAVQIMCTDPLQYFLPSECCQLEDTRTLHMVRNNTTKVYATLHQVMGTLFAPIPRSKPPPPNVARKPKVEFSPQADIKQIEARPEAEPYWVPSSNP